MRIKIPVSVAELFDKITILEIKINNIDLPEDKFHIEKELSSLLKLLNTKELYGFLKSDLFNELKEVNKTLWRICEIRRTSENNKIFGDKFIQQSRLEYKTNDKRALIKSQINKYFDSEIIEVKSYKNLSY